jgi:hypothetical protein
MLLNSPDAEQRLNGSLRWLDEARPQQCIHSGRRNDRQLAERCFHPRHPLNDATGVIWSCGRRRRWSVVLATTTSSSVRRPFAATPRCRGTNPRRFHTHLLKANTCLCFWCYRSNTNGHQRDQCGYKFQVVTWCEHDFHPGIVRYYYYPQRRGYCLVRQNPD